MIDGVASEAILRLVFTVSVFAALAGIELWLPRRSRAISRRRRWPGNIFLQLVNATTVRSLFFWLVPVVVALKSEQLGAGFFNLVSLPAWLSMVTGILVLDLVVYWQHRLMHTFPLLWRLHRVHHADRDVDASTALRFHPFEIILSLALKSFIVVLLGIPADAVLVFAILLNGMAMFNHANIGLPAWLDKKLRIVVVTPDMHRVHHSVIGTEHNRNFGFNLSCWDRWFGSYQAQPKAGHENMILGLNETNDQNTGSLVWMLKNPFK